MSPTAENVEDLLTPSNTAAVPAWKLELNERLAATRLRRIRSLPEQAALPGLEGAREKGESRAARLAATVAQRYANAPSYRDVLAAQENERRAAARERRASEPLVAGAPATPTVAAFPDWRVAVAEQDAAASVEQEEAVLAACEPPEPEQVVEPLAVNLIEFPRELVAARKMRPRLAEGPLREAANEVRQADTQARIEVNTGELLPENISQSVSIGPAPANWSPILLDDDEAGRPVASAACAPPQMTLEAASLENRLMAAVFDGALIVAAFAVFVLVFVACTTHPPTGKPALLSAGLVLSGFAFLYHYLFFRFAEGTPGMRYAKIALCTFEDENPTRQAMCRRVFFLVLSAAPLGMGFLWACFDQDRLGWHDRIARVYQRSYS